MTKEIIQVADNILTKQLEWIKAADSKLGPVFAINTAMLGVIAALVPSPSSWTIPGAVTTALAVIPITLSVIFLAAAAFPRLNGPRGSHVFFGGIASSSQQDFTTRINRGYSQDLADDLIFQAYRNAEIAKTKYDSIKHSMISMFIAMPLWAIAVWMLYPAPSV